VTRQNVFTGVPWEEIVGYCRAVRIGNTVHVAGTTAVDSAGTVVAPGDAYAQTAYILGIIVKALATVNARPSDVVRTRMFVTDISHWEAIGRAHGEVFRGIHPAATMVQVAALIHPEMLVEIEVDAFVE